MPRATAEPKKKAAPKRKKPAANGYRMPEKMPLGLILTDMAKNQWKLGPSIGSGGFGEIYSACKYKSGTKETFNYVVKIEPHENGPLFVEMHFYMRNAKPTDITAWMKSKGLTHLGMPRYIGSGSYESPTDKYRFLVMERFGKDLWTVFLESGRQFPAATICRIGYQVLNALEYIHSRGYVHADIKGANILLDVDTKLHHQTYLVDFGLAAHYTTKDYKPDPKKAHNGTIEYTSRDAHDGVLTRRGDIEILFYNLLQWFGNTLPWERDLTVPVNVQKEKIKFFKSGLKDFKNLPDSIQHLFKYIQKMEFNEEPDYSRIRSWLMEGIKNKKDELIFKPSPKVIKKPRTKSLDKSLNDASDGSIILPSPDVIIKTKIKPTPRKVITKRSLTPKVKTPTPKKKLKSITKKIESESEEEEEEEITPKPRGRQIKKIQSEIIPKRIGRNRKVEESDNEEEFVDAETSLQSLSSDIENKGTPNTGSRFHPKNIGKKKTPTPKRKVLGVVSPKSETKIKKVVKKSTRSWKDCPTIRNGLTSK